jgi:hypothetical protein
LGNYLASNTTLSCAMNNPGTGQGYNPGTDANKFSSVRGANPGGNIGGAEPAYHAPRDQVENYVRLMGRHAAGQRLTEYEYNVIFSRFDTMEAQANSQIANDQTTLIRRIECRRIILELDALRADMLSTVQETYPNNRRP